MNIITKNNTFLFYYRIVILTINIIILIGRRPPRLGEVFARPALEGKRLPGDIEIHTNGIRYQGLIRNDQKIGKY